MNKNLRILSLVLCLVLVATSLVGCGKGKKVKDANLKEAAYNTTTSVMPSNWNEFTYADNNDTQIMSYITSSFFEYDYKFENDEKFNKDGTINKDAIVPGAYTTNYSAATKLEDVTSEVDAKWGYTAEQKEEGGYAWKITLRKDLKWDDGTAITAADFVYSMQQLLDPAFMNFRANTYYDTLMIKNSKAYFFQNQEGTYETIGSQGFESLAAAVASGKTVYANAWNMWGAEGYKDAAGNECPEWVAITDATVYSSADGSDSVSGKMLYEGYGNYLEPGTGYDAAVYVENNTTYTVEFVDWNGKVLSTQTVEYGKPATAPVDPTRAGYVFAGWDKDFTAVKSDLTINAKYIENVVYLMGDFNNWDKNLAATATEDEVVYKLTLSKGEYGFKIFTLDVR